MPISLSAVIFDYGNVLCEPQVVADIQAMADLLHLPIHQFQELYWRDRMPYDASAFDGVVYWERLAAAANRRVSIDDIEMLRQMDVKSWSRPRPAMVDWARRIRHLGTRTAILSNMPSDLRNSLTQDQNWLPSFDNLTFSCDVRMTKPSASIYEHCLAGLGSTAGETLFLDDRPDNVAAAQRLGIHSFVFTTPCDAASALEGQFELPAEIEC